MRLFPLSCTSTIQEIVKGSIKPELVPLRYILINETYIYTRQGEPILEQPMMVEPSLAVVQNLRDSPAYRVSELYRLAGSRATAYRLLERLLELGLAERLNRGYFSLRSSAFQPYRLWPYLVPSLQSFKEARVFGRAYDESDVNYAKKTLHGFLSLDYRAYELTQLQTPHQYYLYVDRVEEAAQLLKTNGFSEGKAGRVSITPSPGNFENEIQRVYLDCLAAGGRSTLDAIAIEIRYRDQLAIRGEFPVDLVTKVEEDLPA